MIKTQIAHAIFTAFYVLLLLGISAFWCITDGAECFPDVLVEENWFDFGVIGEGITVTHGFVFENRGSADLKLFPIQVS
ncbi:MAG: hypothetical protein R6T98_08870 [Desulfatiglandales bacterium]